MPQKVQWYKELAWLEKKLSDAIQSNDEKKIHNAKVKLNDWKTKHRDFYNNGC